jgi:4-amino-4-deoxy-L-arabinose transferase-like glycosyltransferase
MTGGPPVPADAAAPSSPPLRGRVVALLLAGAALYVGIGIPDTQYVVRQLLFAVAGLALALLPWTRPVVARWLERVRHPSPRRRAVTACVVALLATGYLIATGVFQGRDFVPKSHDEHMYLLQMQMLAHGRLWMPQHPLADFFETTHVLVKPVYAAIYFPGTALMYVPGVWLKLPYWVLPAVMSGASVGLLYRLITELLDDGAAGLLAALMLVALRWFRHLSLIVMSHTVELFLGLLIVWVLLRWRRSRRLGWLVLLGALGGWAAITRPVDAIAYAVPVGAAVLWELRRASWRQIALAVALPCLAAAPFLSLQLVLDRGVTGRWTRTPYQEYVDLFNPGLGYGFATFDPSVRPKTTLQQKQDYYDEFVVPEVKSHRLANLPAEWLRNRLPRMAGATLSSTFLLVLVPLGLLGLTSLPRRVLAATLPLYILLYLPFTSLLAHYALVVAPAIILLALLGKQQLEQTWPAAPAVRDVLTLAIAGMSCAFLPELNPNVADDLSRPTMVYSYKLLPELVEKPAIVLFTYRPGASVHEEPVYNVDIAWPDDAPIIRAHNLGPERNKALLAYYAKRQPNRHVYVFDRTTAELKSFGTVGELYRHVMAATLPAATRAATAPATGPASAP